MLGTWEFCESHINFPFVPPAQSCVGSVKSSVEMVAVVSWSAKGTIRLTVSSCSPLRKETDFVIIVLQRFLLGLITVI